jgi:hypothetical protein
VRRRGYVRKRIAAIGWLVRYRTSGWRQLCKPYAADAEKEATVLEAGLCSRAPFVGQGCLHCHTREAQRPSAGLSK